ncbi:MAG: alginate export family protein [Deltaproteobacteria bacterium]|nr:alginate export family protein [Deltaproteobacteria bacterium]
MKGFRSPCLLVLIFLATTVFGPLPAQAQLTLKEFTHNQGRISADLEVLGRYEYWNWFAPKNTADQDYGYFFTRSRMGLGFANQYLKAYIQAQNTMVSGLPNDALAPAPAGPLGIGAIYYLHDREENYGSTIIRQAFLELPDLCGSGITLKGGRFDYIDGKEVMYKNPKINWLKNIRLAEKLIGPFGWSAFCRSFDGFQASYDQDKFNLTAMIFHPTQGGFKDDAHKTIDDIDLATLTATFKYDGLLPHCEGRLFYFFYDDERNIAKVDNGNGLLNQGDITIHTLGLHLLTTRKTAAGIWDALLWAAYQDGDWGPLDHQAWSLNIEGGYQFTKIFGQPWLRLGYAASSGDDNPGDHDHGTFFQLLPTARKYALFPFYNLMNSRDWFAQLIVKPHSRLVLRGDLHFLSLSEGRDRWYMGARPTQENGSIFGYIGRPSFGDRDLATVAELTAMAGLSKNLAATVYYGHAFGKEVIENIYQDDDDGDFFYLELKLAF